MFIKKLRQQHHLSQLQLAEQSGLSLRTIQRVESGHRIGYSSLRALAKLFNIDLDELEQELYSMDKLIKDAKAQPWWFKFYMGSGWFAASRQELKKVELFFMLMALMFGLVWMGNALWTFMPQLPEKITLFGLIATLLGAYNTSVTIRLGDKYQVWCKLESSLPRGIFGFFKG